MRLLPTKNYRRVLAGLYLALAATGVAQGAAHIEWLVQHAPLAGFQYHAGEALWDQLRVGDVLELRRAADNPHDALAVEVRWQGHLLGYLPRAENDAVAGALDRGQQLTARISRLTKDRNPWRRIQVAVYALLP